MKDLTETAVVWKHTGSGEFPYTAEVEGRRFTIRINDFPAEPLSTLIADGVELQDLEDRPPAWVFREPPQALLDLLAPKKKPGAAPSAPRTQLQRLARILEERGMPLKLALAAVDATNEPRIYMEVSALSRRLTLLVAHRPEVVAALLMPMPAADPSSRPLLKMFLDGDQLHVAATSVGKVHGYAGGQISSRRRFLTEPRGALDVFYEARAQDVDDRFVVGVDEVMSRVGVAPSQRELWKSVHASMAGAAAMITTGARGDTSGRADARAQPRPPTRRPRRHRAGDARARLVSRPTRDALHPMKMARVAMKPATPPYASFTQSGSDGASGPTGIVLNPCMNSS